MVADVEIKVQVAIENRRCNTAVHDRWDRNGVEMNGSGCWVKGYAVGVRMSAMVWGMMIMMVKTVRGVRCFFYVVEVSVVFL